MPAREPIANGRLKLRYWRPSVPAPITTTTPASIARSGGYVIRANCRRTISVAVTNSTATAPKTNPAAAARPTRPADRWAVSCGYGGCWWPSKVTTRSPLTPATTAAITIANEGRQRRRTSKANSTPAQGTAKTEPNPPASAAWSNVRRWPSVSLRPRPLLSARLPAICRATPSRPTEAPNRWATTVAPHTSGAIRRGTPAEVGLSLSVITNAVPPAARPPKWWYTAEMAKAAAGSSQISQAAWSSRNAMARPRVSRKTNEATPAGSPANSPSPTATPSSRALPDPSLTGP